jgi:hypothetical protein
LDAPASGLTLQFQRGNPNSAEDFLALENPLGILPDIADRE